MTEEKRKEDKRVAGDKSSDKRQDMPDEIWAWKDDTDEAGQWFIKPAHPFLGKSVEYIKKSIHNEMGNRNLGLIEDTIASNKREEKLERALEEVKSQSIPIDKLEEWFEKWQQVKQNGVIPPSEYEPTDVEEFKKHGGVSVNVEMVLYHVLKDFKQALIDDAKGKKE